MEIEEFDDDLDYYDLPSVDPSQYYEQGQCIRNKKPYSGEPELMILEIHPDKDYYLVQALYGDGKASWRERLQIKDAHYYYQPVK